MLLAGAGGGQRRSVGGVVAPRSARPEDEEGEQRGGAGAGRLPQPALPERLCQRAGQAAAQAHDRPAAEDPPPPVPPDQGERLATRLRARSSDECCLATMSKSEGGAQHSVASGNAIFKIWASWERSLCMQPARQMVLLPKGHWETSRHQATAGGLDKAYTVKGSLVLGAMLASRRQPGSHKQV